MASEAQLDSSNVQAPGAAGELEPFIKAENAEFVGMLMAYHLRRGANRIAAVNHGTAHNMAPQVVSAGVRELSLHYHFLLEQVEKDKKSLDLYEAMIAKQLEVDTWLLELKEVSSGDERKKLLIQVDKALVAIEEMTERMEKLSDA